MATTLVRKVLLKIAADDGDTEAKLDAISAKADELKALHPELSVKIDTAAASAKLAALRAELKETSLAAGELRDSEVEAGAAGEAAAGGGLSMMAVGIAGLIGLAAAVAPAVVAAGAAFGAFGLFALPALKSVSGAYTQIQADQLAYNRALTASAKSTALAHLKADYAALSPAQAGAVKGIQQLVGEYHNLSKAFAPEAFSLLTKALGIVSGLLPKLVPLAQAGAKAAGQLMDALGKGLNSKGFSDLLTMLGQLSGPATGALIGLAGTIGGVLVNALEQLAPYAVPMIKMLQALVAAAGPALIGALKLLAQVVMDVGRAITPVLGPLGKFFGYLSNHPVFAQIITGIIGIVAAVKIFTGAMAIVDAVMAANPFVLLAIAIAVVAILIATHTHQIAQAFDVVRHAVAELGHDVAVWFDRIRHDIAQWAGDARHDVNLVISFFEGLPKKFETWFDEIRHAIATKFDQAVTYVKGIPGRIVSALASLPGKLFSSGKAAVSMFIAGLKSIPVVGTVIGWGQDILDHIPHSPAKKGPLSGAGDPTIGGRKIGLMLAAGMQSSVPAVSASAAHLARAAGIGVTGHPGYGAASSASANKVQIQLTGGDKAFRTWLKKSIRTTGGNVTVIGA